MRLRKFDFIQNLNFLFISGATQGISDEQKAKLKSVMALCGIEWTCISKNEKVLFFYKEKVKTKSVPATKIFGTPSGQGSKRCIIMEISLFKFLSY